MHFAVCLHRRAVQGVRHGARDGPAPELDPPPGPNGTDPHMILSRRSSPLLVPGQPSSNLLGSAFPLLRRAHRPPFIRLQKLPKILEMENLYFFVLMEDFVKLIELVELIRMAVPDQLAL
jgi:hypothetical protein